MYYYKGYDPDSKQILKKSFDDEGKAIDFGRDNYYRFPKYAVKDEDGDLIDSDEIANSDAGTAMDGMFPDEDSMEGFDVNEFFGNE